MPRLNLLQIDDQLITTADLFPTAPISLWLGSWGGGRWSKRKCRAWALNQLVDAYVKIPASELLRDSRFYGGDTFSSDLAIRAFRCATTRLPV